LFFQVPDFGVSRLTPVPYTEGNVPGHVSTVVKGTRYGFHNWICSQYNWACVSGWDLKLYWSMRHYSTKFRKVNVDQCINSSMT